MIKKIFVMFFTCFSFLLFTCVANASVTHMKDNTGETKTIKAENVQITTDQEILSEPSKINFINEIEKEDHIKHLKQGHKIIQRGVAKFPYVEINEKTYWLTEQQVKDIQSGKKVKVDDVTILSAADDIRYLTLSCSIIDVYDPKVNDPYQCHYLFMGYAEWQYSKCKRQIQPTLA